jgi:PIN domain nuclease of toxin-antitoxin system
MKLLLDTNALLWLLNDDRRLAPRARQIIENSQGIAVSEVSLWEISIKVSIGKLQSVPELLDTVRDLGFRRLSLSDEHLRFYETLPLLHRDPFDRMLVAQASIEGMSLLTSNSFLDSYGISVVSTG